MSKKVLFTAITWFMPLLILLSLELGLRLAGYGQSYPLVVTSPSQPEYVTLNPDWIKRYFQHNAMTPKVSPDTYYFTPQKPANTTRIILLGGSTAAGFPYGRFGSPAGLLTHQLRAVHPQHDIEVIPIAMASINSYALRDIAEEVIALNPDAVLVYAGHNEYLGVMGVGSAFANKGGHLTNLLFLALRDIRLFQLIQRVVNSTPVEEENSAGRTTMAKMAKEQNIAFDSPLYHAGIDQFKRNMAAVTKAFSQANIPVLMGNLVANEKDLTPFASDDPADLPSADILEQANKTIDVEFAQLNQWQATHPYSANLAYLQGKLRLHRQEHKDALHAFTQAKDYDLLRFRAPSAFNNIIGELTSNGGVHQVDLDAYFRQGTQDGIIGEKLMLEHLHPTVRGYFLMADAFLRALEQQGIVPPATYPLAKSQPFRWQQVPLSEVDMLIGQRKIDQLTSDYPFQDEPSKLPPITETSPINRFAKQRESGQSWLAQQPALLSYYQQQQQWHKAANVAALLFESLPNNTQAAQAATSLYLRAGQNRLAWYYARQGVKLAPDNSALLLGLAQAQYRSGEDGLAAATLERVLAVDPTNQQAQTYLNNLRGQP